MSISYDEGKQHYLTQMKQIFLIKLNDLNTIISYHTAIRQLPMHCQIQGQQLSQLSVHN